MLNIKTSYVLDLIFKYYCNKNSFIVFTNGRLIRVVMNIDGNEGYKNNKHIII